MRKPWESPSYIPGSPHNLPVRPLPGQTTSDTYLSSADATVDIRDVYRYASIVTINITVGTTSVKFLDSPIGKRNFLGFRNVGLTTIYIDFNQNASTTAWLALTSGTIILLDTVVPQDDLYALSSGAGGSLTYAYSTFAG